MSDSSLQAGYNRTVLLLSGSGFAASVNLRSMDTLLPKLSEDFGVTVGQAAYVVTAYAIGYGTCQLAVGLIGDRFGKFQLIVVLCVLSAAVTALSSLATSIPELAAARMLAGVAASGIVPLAMAWIGDQIPIGQRQAVMARYMTGTIAGALLGQVIGGILAEHFGWRATTLIFAAGFLLVAAALLSDLRKASRVGLKAAPGGPGLLQNLREIRGNSFALTVLAGVVIEGIAIFGALTFAGASLHLRFGLGLGWVGAMLACFAIGGLLYSFVVGGLLRRFPAPALIRTGGALSACGLLVLGLSPLLWTMPIAITVMGFGFYLIHNPLQVHATQILPSARGTGVALFATCLFLAQSLGVALGAPLVDIWGLWPICVISACIMAVTGLWLARRFGGTVGNRPEPR